MGGCPHANVGCSYAKLAKLRVHAVNAGFVTSRMLMANECQVTLARQTSKKPCVGHLDAKDRPQTFGCNGSTTMWITGGCRGEFQCAGQMVTCGHLGLAYAAGTQHRCTCAPYHEGGTFKAGTGRASMVLPHGLELHTPRLTLGRNVPQGGARFVPTTPDDVLVATFTLWNLLDATMHELSPDNNYQTGYVRELQVRRMVQLVQQQSVKSYCEVGFNGGHSAVAMLLANPRLVVHSFDLMMWPYSEPAVSLVTRMFGQRFKIHRGDSGKTVPSFTSILPHRCDVVFVDGDHSRGGTTRDLLNMRQAASPSAIGVADDINSLPGAALEDLAARGSVEVLESYGPFEAPSRHNDCMRTASRGPLCLSWGFAVFRYTNTTVNERRGCRGRSARPLRQVAGGAL